MKRYKPTLIALVTLSNLLHPIVSTPLQAQTAEQPIIRCRFRAMVWSGMIRDLFYLKDGEAVPFTATSANPSKWLEYQGPSPLVIYKKGETFLNSEGVSVPRPVATFTAKNKKDHMLMLFPLKDEPLLKYEVLGFEEELGKIEEGFRVINLTNADVAILLNEEMKVLKSGNSVHLSPTLRTDNSVQTSIAIQNKEKGEWQIKYQNIFRAKPGMRQTVFVTMPEGNVNIRKFVERTAKPELDNESI